MQILSAEYERVLEQLSELLTNEKDLIANASNVCAFLSEALDAVDWVGIYFLRNGQLVLGPFQGQPAASRISLGNNPAGRAVRDLRSVITHGNEEYTEAAEPVKAQIVSPILLHDRCIGVLQIDSPFAGRFHEEDRAGLEAIGRMLIDASDTTPLIPKRTSITELRNAVTVPTPPAVASTVTETRERPEMPDQPAPYRTPMPSYHEEIAAPFMTAFRLRQSIAPIIALGMLISATRSALNTMPAASVTTTDTLIHALFAIVAFTALGTAIGMAWRIRVRRVAGITCGYALFLAMVQIISGVQLSIPAHGLDLVCGLLGGYLGGAIGRALRRRSRFHQRV